MTLLPDKPKRKRKEKPKRQSQRGLKFLLFLLILVILGVLAYVLLRPPTYDVELPDGLVNPPDGDPFTPLCDFMSTPYLFVGTTAGNFMTTIMGDDVIPLPRSFNINHWSKDSQYVWGDTRIKRRGANPTALNLVTGELHYFDWEQMSYNTSFAPNLRYAMYSTFSNEVSEIVIFDAETGKTVHVNGKNNKTPLWSADSTLVVTSTDIINVLTGESLNVEFPADATQLLRWKDADTIIYETRAGWLREWNFLSEKNEKFYSTRFDDYYVSDNVQRSPNFRSNANQGHSNMAGIEAPDMFHVLNIQTNDYVKFTVDVSGGLDFSVKAHYVLFEYDDSTKPIQFYYPATHDFAEVQVLRQYDYSVSPDGHYIYYWKDETMNNHIIQRVATGETFVVDDAENTIYTWHEIEGISYLLHTMPVGDGVHVHYLLNPESRTNCKLGTFYSPHIQIQS